jgi:hypothetical protein
MIIRPKILLCFENADLREKAPDFNYIACMPEEYPVAELTSYTKLEELTEERMKEIEDSIVRTLDENPDIDGVFADIDIEIMILSAVLNKYPRKLNFTVPSYENIFLCKNKYYQRLHDRNPIKFSYIDIFADDWDKNLPSFPFFLKPTDLLMSMFQYVIRDRAQLKEMVLMLRENLPHFNREFRYFHEKYLDVEKYPLATRHIMLCEELVQNAQQISWEGWADNNGDVHSYSVEYYGVPVPGLIAYTIVPYHLPQETKYKVEKTCSTFLKDIGFKNGFVHIELWIREDGDIKIIEVNPRACFVYLELYRKTYGIELVEDIAKISRGEKPDLIPFHCQNVKTYSCIGLISTKLNGKVKDLIDLDALEREKKEHPDYVFWSFNEDLLDPDFEIVDNIENAGRLIVTISFGKDTFEKTEQEIRRLRKVILKKEP